MTVEGLQNNMLTLKTSWFMVTLEDVDTSYTEFMKQMRTNASKKENLTI